MALSPKSYTITPLFFWSHIKAIIIEYEDVVNCVCGLDFQKLVSSHKNHVILKYIICFPQKVLNVTFIKKKLSKIIIFLPKLAILVYGSKIC